MASVKNLASGTLVSGINTTDTSLTVNVGNGTSAQLLGVWPDVPFYVTVAPSSPSSGVTNSLDSEIMLVTSIKTGTSTLNMTVTRAQRDTTAKAFNADDIVTNAVYAEDAVLLGPNGTTESPSPWIQTGDILNGAVTNDKIADGTISNDKLDSTAINRAIPTSDNIGPSTDKPSDWITLLNTYATGSGYFLTQYNTSGCFTNQPAVYGGMESFITGSRITQRFTGSDGVVYSRTGGSTGWYGSASDPGVFQIILNNSANSVPATAIDWSSMYVAAAEPASNISVPSSGAIVQTITLPAGKWRVFSQFRISVAGMTASTTRFIYAGFKNGSAMSSNTINQLPFNITSDSAGSGRCVLTMTSKEITSTGSYVVSSYVILQGSSTDTQSLSKDPGIYLFAIRVG